MRILRLQMDRLPEGVWLATSNDVQGLVAQGATFSETVEFAQDVARHLIEAQGRRDDPGDGFDVAVVAELDAVPKS